MRNLVVVRVLIVLRHRTDPTLTALALPEPFNFFTTIPLRIPTLAMQQYGLMLIEHTAWQLHFVLIQRNINCIGQMAEVEFCRSPYINRQCLFLR